MCHAGVSEMDIYPRNGPLSMEEAPYSHPGQSAWSCATLWPVYLTSDWVSHRLYLRGSLVSVGCNSRFQLSRWLSRTRISTIYAAVCDLNTEVLFHTHLFFSPFEIHLPNFHMSGLTHKPSPSPAWNPCLIIALELPWYSQHCCGTYLNCSLQSFQS